ncbi:FliM/FliN family flagellar motor switch protein [Tepidamorphus sp. 3E244]|uniref:FliM/FliN family flagellar motor switch protein n=1 Tax=Tepidamorphus sp. 3E244 TaxID=3385498 RepID=UPI0038FC589F
MARPRPAADQNCHTMSLIGSVQIDLAVHLGSATMPVHQLLRMGRGAVIEMASQEAEVFTLYANDKPVAKGEVIVDGDRIKLQIIEMLLKGP